MQISSELSQSEKEKEVREELKSELDKRNRKFQEIEAYQDNIGDILSLFVPSEQ